MSNASLISRVEQALTRYERGELTAPEVERAIDLHVLALEQIRTPERNDAGHLAARLVNADLSDPPAEFNGQLLTFEGDELITDVVRDLRAFLARLPR
jgi:hypothetical protein